MPKRRLGEKTALSKVSVEVLQKRLLNGQDWANEEFSRWEKCPGPDECEVSLIYDLDRENECLEEMVRFAGISCKRLEAKAAQMAEEDEELFLQTRTVNFKKCVVIYHFGFHH